MIMTDTREELQNIKAPTLVMVGERDVITPLDAGPDGAAARFMAERIFNAELCVLAGCGHGNLVERADESLERITEFLLRPENG